MTDPSPETPKRSLAMRRIAINRSRTLAMAAVVIGVISLIFAVALLFSGGNLVIRLAQLAFGILLVVFGILRVNAARRELRKFEQENGPGAGDQRPVR